MFNEKKGPNIEGRKMKYQPWAIDELNNYRSPTEKEMEEIYGISGEAIAETLAYFEECNGNMSELILLLNQHVINEQYIVSKEILSDCSRWYTNEFYFYFQIFCKKIIRQFNWHYGENKSGQLSKYHKIWEKGFLQYSTFGKNEKGEIIKDYAGTNVLVVVTYLENVLKINSDEVFEIINDCNLDYYEVWKNDILEHNWLSAEYVQYFYEISKVVSNSNNLLNVSSLHNIISKLKVFNLLGSIPKRFVINMLRLATSKVNTIYDYKILKFKNNVLIIEGQMRKNFNLNQFDVYRLSCLMNSLSLNQSVFASIIRHLFKLKELPDKKITYQIENDAISFVLEFSWKYKNEIMIKWILLAALFSALIFFVSYFSLLATAILLSCTMLVFLYVFMRVAAEKKEYEEKLLLVNNDTGAIITELEMNITQLTLEKIELIKMRNEAERRLKITEIYTRRSLVNVIGQGGDPTKYLPKSENIAILFSDIRDFTTMSEKLNPFETVNLLNNYFNQMNNCITENNGEIDKLIGDCIMALFFNPDQSVTSAIQMRTKLAELNLQNKSFMRLNNGVGINYGGVVLGNIGSETKMDYTVIGDIVNSASRMEAMTKYYGLPIIISEELKNVLKGKYYIRFIDEVLVKGKKVPTKIYEVFDHERDEIISMKLKNQEQMDAVYALYLKGNFVDAAKNYHQMIQACGSHNYLEKKCSDPVLNFYYHRCMQLQEKKTLGLLEDWDGIFEFTDK